MLKESFHDHPTNTLNILKRHTDYVLIQQMLKMCYSVTIVFHVYTS